MLTWWNNLGLEIQFFYAIGIVAALVMLGQFVLMVLGLDHGGDVPDLGADAVHDSGMGVFSVRTVMAFFAGFGWTGVIAMKAGLGLVPALGLALLSGGGLMAAMYFLILNMMKLQDSGTLDYHNAVGQVGTVYVTIPGAMKGPGQVEVMIQGRLAVAEAFTKNEADLRPQTKVEVKGTIGQNGLLVEPLVGH